MGDDVSDDIDPKFKDDQFNLGMAVFCMEQHTRETGYGYKLELTRVQVASPGGEVKMADPWWTCTSNEDGVSGYGKTLYEAWEHMCECSEIKRKRERGEQS